jgi:hypothetical protein
MDAGTLIGKAVLPAAGYAIRRLSELHQRKGQEWEAQVLREMGEIGTSVAVTIISIAKGKPRRTTLFKSFSESRLRAARSRHVFTTC